jgi:hypothetical protein
MTHVRQTDIPLLLGKISSDYKKWLLDSLDGWFNLDGRKAFSGAESVIFGPAGQSLALDDGIFAIYTALPDKDKTEFRTGLNLAINEANGENRDQIKEVLLALSQLILISSDPSPIPQS